MVTAKAKRAAIARVFGNIPADDSDYVNFLYKHRHFVTVRDGKWRDLAFVVEADDLEAQVRRTLDRIRKRDGARVAREVAGRLADSLAAQ